MKQRKLRAPARMIPWVALAALLINASALHAQGSDEVRQLSPFEVTADADVGYVTTSSAVTSRIAIPILELPSSVITINERVMEDTVALNFEDLSSLVASVGPPTGNSQMTNNVNMRGFGVSVSQRDGIPDRLMSAVGGFDTGLIERLEFIKGPSGILYGNHSPAGIINIVSKRPLGQPRTRVSAMMGSFNTRRLEIDHSSFFELNDRRFGYRVVGVTKHTDGPDKFPVEPSNSLESFHAINPSISYQFENGLNVWLWGAFVRDSNNRMNRTAHAYRTGPNSGRVLIREAELGSGNNIFVSLNEMNSDTIEAGLTHSFDLGAVTADVRLVWRNFDLYSDSSRIRGIGPGVDHFFDADGNRIGNDSRNVDYDEAERRLAFVARRAVRFDDRPSTEKGNEYAADLNLNFEIGPTRNSLVLFGTYSRFDSASEDGRIDITDPAKLLQLGAEQFPDGVFIRTNPNPTFRPTVEQMRQFADITVARSTVANEDTLYGLGALARVAFWNNRAFIVGGIRRNGLDTDSFQIVANQPTGLQNNKDTTTLKSIAGLVKLYRGENGEVSAFYNRNRTFIPVFTTDRRLATFGQRFPNRVAEVDEFGLKADLFNHRLVLTATYFEITETNVLLQFQDADGSVTGQPPPSTYSAPVGSRTSDGYEIDLNISPLPGWDAIISYANFDAILEDGTRSPNVASSTFSVLNRYEIQEGPLTGLSGAWIYNYWGDSILGTRTNWDMPSGWLHSAVIGYRWGKMSFNLRIENVFDKLKARPGTFETAVALTPGRNYRLAVNYTF